MPEFKQIQFKRVSRNGKTDLCMLGQFIFDRETPQMSEDVRNGIAKETKEAIDMVMSLIPRRL